MVKETKFFRKQAVKAAERAARAALDPETSESLLAVAKAYRSQADVLKAKKKAGKKRRQFLCGSMIVCQNSNLAHTDVVAVNSATRQVTFAPSESDPSGGAFHVKITDRWQQGSVDKTQTRCRTSWNGRCY